MADMGLLQAVGYLVLILLPVMYFTSQTFRYNVKFFMFYLLFTMVSTFWMPVFIFNKLRGKDAMNLWGVSYVLGAVFSIYRMDIEVRNVENLSKEVPCVIMSNHQSSLDMWAFFKCMPKRGTALGKKELLYSGPFGAAAWLSAVVFVDRLNHEKARSTMDNAVKKVIANKLQLWVFPEGTRNNNGSMLPFKKGGFHLAVQAQVPVVPVVFSSYLNFLDNKAKRFDRGKIIATCLPPISTKGLGSEDVNALTERVRNQMLEVYKQISIETGALPRQ